MTRKNRVSLPDLQIACVRSSRSSEFDCLLKIYEDSLPANERKPREAVRLMAASPDYRFLIATAAGVVRGFAILAYLGTTALLEYMAVREEDRGRGVGAQLFQAATHDDARAVLVEVEADDVPGPEQAAQARRKRFYRELGCAEISGLRYLMPSVATSQPGPMHLLLWRADAGRHTDERTRTVPRAVVQEWLQAIYSRVYGQATKDPRIATMIATLPEEIVLR